ncbi:V-type ATPase, G subunit, variant [Phytophthora nicotianae CJ01A1]|uniref:V-type ATPase, G subunit, variant n=6 Tax=Phytophthora nicotianae TaxID=4792 RepID=W2R3D5_PHYN3|nr:V-type ATPase, G subunit, variant [Phytophthora nicotianae INRA-310]ETI39032.1 V-type ATPase, G subunit, variant [Phytophthora nicotianae P1569]ETK79220.1 V-type ATPase, G subunit, variant [Phytophthora nicotianae]ETO67769.1 V-type ATPase, G subunit, variant [Phytophthora nicotianae P1976]ETP08934.1 V-type ATPase, G subunit, variant [Phytophthora nicotianae CJ01A1]ETP36968.1 V-type ATPase, G subunit, variant [Phytophthora nicotianae P10297]
MAANQSIKELMAAETKASKVISEARQERGERLKQAKLEAEAEITAYRKQMERSFQMNGNTDVRETLANSSDFILRVFLVTVADGR